MPIIENTPRRIVLKGDSGTVTFDKDAGAVKVERKLLIFGRKPVEFPFADIDDVAVKSDVDGLSGAPIYHAVMHRRTGDIFVLTTEEGKDAAATVATLRTFLGMAA